MAIGAELGKEAMVRALAAKAYQHGAKFVDVQYFDMHVKRARILDADEETLGYVPPWYGTRILELGRMRCARIGLSGPATPGLLDDLDPRRAGRDQLPFVREAGVVVNERTTNWTIVPYPTLGWARQVHPDVPGDEALGPPVRADPARLPPRRGRPRRGVEGARGPARRHRRARDRAALRRPALRGPGHRPHGRAAADDALHGGALRDRRRHRPHAQPAVGGDLRRSRSAAHRRRGAGDQAARHRRLDHQGPRGRVPRRQGGAHRRRRGRRRAARLRGARRGRVAAGRGRARRRRRPHRQARARCSSTRCSTRTRRRTSRSARATRFTAGEEDRAAPQPLLDPRRLHDRRRRRGASPASPAPARTSPSCATAPGSSSAAPAATGRRAARLSRAWRGAGAVERARLEIVCGG